jgi:predicted regulator of Ras-like GTPase activity (Roadblock/LC7/MglB family)
MPAQSNSGFDLLESILFEMNSLGKFPRSVLTDKEGLSIASAASDDSSSDRQSAVVAFIQKSAIQASKQLGFAELDEITFSYKNGQQLVILPFNAKDKILILTALVTDRNQPYRKITSNAIAEIIKVWDYYWK